MMRAKQKETTDLTESARAFAERVRRLLGERAHGALVYGSVARGEAVEDVSDVNLLLLVDRVDGPLLRELGPAARDWAEEVGRVPPQVMGADEWARARDAFAIELADMADAHVSLFGADPLDGFTLERRSMRLQAERELRVWLLGLHQALLAAGGSPEQVGRLLTGSLPSFATYLRASLRLARRDVPRDLAGVARAGAELIGAQPAPFLQLLEARQQAKSPVLAVDDAVVAGYHLLAERTVAFVDRFQEEETR